MRKPVLCSCSLGSARATAGAAWLDARSRRNGNRESCFRELDKPSFTPPVTVFPLVWTVLYAMIAFGPVGESGARRLRDTATKL